MVSRNHKINNRNSYRKHIDARRTYSRLYYQRNKERILARNAAYRQSNREKVAEGHKKSHAKWYAKNRQSVLVKCRVRTYGISGERVKSLLSRPCEICGGTSHHIDHNHLSGAIRGPLCKHCNWALGHFRDDVGRLQKAIRYLKKHQTS